LEKINCHKCICNSRAEQLSKDDLHVSLLFTFPFENTKDRQVIIGYYISRIKEACKFLDLPEMDYLFKKDKNNFKIFGRCWKYLKEANQALKYYNVNCL